MLSSKNMIITNRSFAIPIYLSSCVLLEICCPLLEKGAAYHMTNDMLFLPTNNLIDPPPLRYRNKKCNSTARPKIDASKAASEHNFSGVGFNFRAFQGISPGTNKIKCFSGSSRFVGHPARFKCTYHHEMMKTRWQCNTLLLSNLCYFLQIPYYLVCKVYSNTLFPFYKVT